jgi:nicotinate-nucleotide adenylyltransferase
MNPASTPPSRIALLGTSADPPTGGHQALLLGLLNRFPYVATWASDNPMKQHGASLTQRTMLLAALVDAIDNPCLELAQDLSSPWAITTLNRASERWPKAQLVFVIGSDLVTQIPRWRQASELLNRCILAVVPRLGWPIRPEELDRLSRLGASIDILPLSIPATMSSTMRQHPTPNQVPPAIWSLLLKHNLYGLATPS